MLLTKDWDDTKDAAASEVSLKYRKSGLKRVFDITFSIALLLTALPFMVIVSAIIYLVDPGPILFGHNRVGRDGKTFRCLKFRTMVVGAEEKLQALLAEDEDARIQWQQSRKLKRDPRILPFIGHALRRSSMDELPQFLNVLAGDMSIVGPRPVTQDELDENYGSAVQDYHKVRPGLSGLWQVSGRSLMSFEERVELDVHYVNTMTFGSDLKILAKTPLAVLARTGAY